MSPNFKQNDKSEAVVLSDPIENARIALQFDRAVTPTSGDPEQFHYPIGNAKRVRAASVATDIGATIVIRTDDGTHVRKVSPMDTPASLPDGDYLLEFAGAAMKVYAQVSDVPIEITGSGLTLEVSFDTQTTIHIGGRSFHTQPSRTLTTTGEPADLMNAVSLFGTAVKTWAPERTFSTLRGHPPLLEQGDEQCLPDGLAPPATGIKLTLPESYDWLYPAVPLAYWLGATVEPGEPALHAGKQRYPLGVAGGYNAQSEQRAYEQHIADIFQLLFQFEAACRGFYDSLPLEIEQRVKKSDIHLDLDAIANEPIDKRTQAFLNIGTPATVLNEKIGRPTWPQTVDVEPTADNSVALPFFADEMAIVRCHKKTGTASRPTQSYGKTGRRPTAGGADPDPEALSSQRSEMAGDSPQNPSSHPLLDHPTDSRLLTLPPTDSIVHSWLGDGVAGNATNIEIGSLMDRVAQPDELTDEVSATVVVNDTSMLEEATFVSEDYGSSYGYQFDVDVRRNLTCNELATVLTDRRDFLHYIGHVEPDGFPCADGTLDAHSLDEVSVDTFILNACSSYQQGKALIERGATAGVVTTEAVPNTEAIRAGRSAARLLDMGFSLSAATEIIQDILLPSDQYTVVGDPNDCLVTAENGAPRITIVNLVSDGRYRVTSKIYPKPQTGVGARYTPYFGGAPERAITVPGTVGPMTLKPDHLATELDEPPCPLVVGGELMWASETDIEDIDDKLQT